MAVRKRIIVLGAGFAGLEFCKSIKAEDVEIIVIDRRNHHLFQPLLYQVATAALSGTDIAQPIRSILRHVPNLTVYLDEVIDIRLAEKKVLCKHHELTYDYLVIALGGKTAYFGHDKEWEPFAPGLKSLDDALNIRQHALTGFEEAENTNDKKLRDQLMTIVVIGGGPTGVEMAGAFSELSRVSLPMDFTHIDPRETRIILIEAAPRILGHLPEDLSASALKQLKALHVDVRLNTMVKNIREGVVELEGEEIRAHTIVWSAGVAASPLTRKLGVAVDRAGRIEVQPDLSVPGYPEVFAAGDLVNLKQKSGALVPGVSPAAMQMGRHIAKVINAELPGHKLDNAAREAFHYHDKGTMATIGRSAAVAQIGSIKLHGRIAWLAWLLVHLLFLVGFRNKVSVLFQWAYNYVRYKRSSRIIFDDFSAQRRSE